MEHGELTERFQFGRNWKSYSSLVDESRVASAEHRLKSLLGLKDLAGRAFLDIGCGSGLHALAALRLGASRVVAIDLDPESVAAARTLLERFAPNAEIEVAHRNVFDLEQAAPGQFDIVYSWCTPHPARR